MESLKSKQGKKQIESVVAFELPRRFRQVAEKKLKLLNFATDLEFIHPIADPSFAQHQERRTLPTYISLLAQQAHLSNEYGKMLTIATVRALSERRRSRQKPIPEKQASVAPPSVSAAVSSNPAATAMASAQTGEVPPVAVTRSASAEVHVASVEAAPSSDSTDPISANPVSQLNAESADNDVDSSSSGDDLASVHSSTADTQADTDDDSSSVQFYSVEKPPRYDFDRMFAPQPRASTTDIEEARIANEQDDLVDPRGLAPTTPVHPAVEAAVPLAVPARAHE
ncbi:MAG: hypothetical protein MHM6MM_007606 [Cercozoa sp. M6MM]